MDVHKGELGTMCASCHNARTFQVTSFTHARPGPFFQGEHASLTCAKCHISTLGPIPSAAGARPIRVGFVDTPERCASCHRDVHLGQLGAACETCHSVQTAHFAVTAFAHERTTFPLTGKHAAVMCIACHKSATADFPSGHGEARVFKGIGTACVSLPSGSAWGRGSAAMRTLSFGQHVRDHQSTPTSTRARSSRSSRADIKPRRARRVTNRGPASGRARSCRSNSRRRA